MSHAFRINGVFSKALLSYLQAHQGSRLDLIVVNTEKSDIETLVNAWGYVLVSDAPSGLFAGDSVVCYMLKSRVDSQGSLYKESA